MGIPVILIFVEYQEAIFYVNIGQMLMVICLYGSLELICGIYSNQIINNWYEILTVLFLLAEVNIYGNIISKRICTTCII